LNDHPAYHWAIACLILLTFACSNNRNSLLPQSGGKAYEVLLVSEDTAVGNRVLEILQTDAEGLPQAEPSFDVSMIKNNALNTTTRLSRNIVIVSVYSNAKTTEIKYEKDAFAQPQMVVYITTPSEEKLSKELPGKAQALRDLLIRAEMNTHISILANNRNRQMEQHLEKELGCRMQIPADMNASKSGKDFFWISNNTPTGMKNICVYTYPTNKWDANKLMTMHDSILQANIPGEKPDMHMKAVGDHLTMRMAKEKNDTLLIIRGLWEMEGDMMGGPFVAHAHFDKKKQRMVVAEAFLYAPESKKRNTIRLLEAALYTFQLIY